MSVQHYADPDGSGPLLRLRREAGGFYVEVCAGSRGWVEAPDRFRDILNGNVMEVNTETADRIEQEIRDRHGGWSLGI